MSEPEPRLVTAADGAFRVGVPVHQVQTWVARGLLYAVGTSDGPGRPRLYTLRRLRELAAAYHERKAARAKTRTKEARP